MIAIILALLLQQSPAQAIDTAADRAATAELATSDREPCWSNGFVEGECDTASDAAAAWSAAQLEAIRGSDRPSLLRAEAVLQDRVAACRQARFVRERLSLAAERVGDDDDDLALAYMWAGFIERRNCADLDQRVAESEALVAP